MAKQDAGVPPSGSGQSAEPEPSFTVSAETATVPNAERPTINSPGVREIAINKLAEDCAEWDKSAPEDWVTTLSRLHLTGDGYELAKELDDRFHIDPDRELVEILDSASHYLWCAEREAVKVWVAENNITPPLTVGTRVFCQRGTGEITSIREEEAAYTVLPDDERDDPKFAHGGGWIIKYGDAQPLTEQVSA